MKLKAGEVNGLVESISGMKDIYLPVKTAYYLARVSAKLDGERKAFEASRIGLLKRYGKKDENGELITSKEGQVEFDDFNAFVPEFEELVSQEIDVDIEKIKIDQLEDKDGRTLISSSIIAGLLPILDD